MDATSTVTAAGVLAVVSAFVPVMVTAFSMSVALALTSRVIRWFRVDRGA